MDTAAMEAKAHFETEALEKSRGYTAAKWALPCLRKRLQLLTYIKKRKMVWSIGKVVELNRDILTDEERGFITSLDKRVKKRENSFSNDDKKRTVALLKKLSHEIIYKELSSLKKKR